MSPAPSQRATVRRLAQRADYEPERVREILDEGLFCHVGFVVDGQPFVIPTAYARAGEVIYIHGSPASRMLRTLRDGVEVCVTVTLLDGLVVARSAFHHSLNYRSVVVFGLATEVRELEQRRDALRAIVEHLVPGRWNDSRPPSDGELKGTMVLALPISEASAKVRSGGPLDDEADYALPHWAGEVPLRLTPLAPLADPRLAHGTVPPQYLLNYRRARRG